MLEYVELTFDEYVRVRLKICHIRKYHGDIMKSFENTFNQYAKNNRIRMYHGGYVGNPEYVPSRECYPTVDEIRKILSEINRTKLRRN